MIDDLPSIDGFQVQRFVNLFKGSTVAYGRFTIKGFNEKKKKHEGKAETISGVATLQNYSSHVEGKIGLGIIPITIANTCSFGVIDIDDYYPDLESDISQKLLNLSAIGYNLKFVCCRSKSGGLHLYVFFGIPVPAAKLQKTLKAYAYAIGYPKTEVFPKQTNLKQGEKGNWINLPYFGDSRHCVYEHSPISLLEFLDLAEQSKMTEGSLECAYYMRKLTGLYVRLCIVHHVMLHVPEIADKSSGTTSSDLLPLVIDASTTKAVNNLILGFLIPHAQKVYSYFGEHRGHPAAEKIANWMLQKRCGEFKRSELTKFAARKELNKLDAPLEYLEQVGWIRKKITGQYPGKGGRPGEKFLVNPLVYERFGAV